jgi:hypothetical protein
MRACPEIKIMSRSLMDMYAYYPAVFFSFGHDLLYPRDLIRWWCSVIWLPLSLAP